MIATFFEWSVEPGREDEFVQSWNEGTQLLLDEGSLGSALFRSENGHFWAHARWPDRQTLDAAIARTKDAPVFARMRSCVAATLHREDTEELSNQWRI